MRSWNSYLKFLPIKVLNGNEITIDTTPGLYFVKMEEGEKVMIKRLLIQP